MGVKRSDRCIIFAVGLCFLAVAIHQTHAEVYQINPEDDIECAVADPTFESSSPREGLCVAADLEDNEFFAVYGIRPDGKCGICGRSASCTNASVVSYFKRDDRRYCGCNVGYYGSQSGSGCKKCPSGTTTKGYGATGIKDCSVCAEGFTGSAASNSCKACSSSFTGAVTTAGPANNNPCVCPAGYTGSPGKCKKCVGRGVTTAFPGAQTCICPAGGKPPFCQPCLRGEVVNGKCECPAGLTGVWPNCKTCPTWFGYLQRTFTPGKNQACKCSLLGGFEDLENREILDADAKTGSCKCDEGRGRYLTVVQLTFESESEYGSCNLVFNAADGHKVLVLNGVKRLGCDSSKGLGVNVAKAVRRDAQGYCIPCNGTQQKIDPTTTRCECKSGYGINPFYTSVEDPANYCIKLNSPNLILGTLDENKPGPYILPNKNLYARCNASLKLVLDRSKVCKKCADPAVMTADWRSCNCPEGYKSIFDSQFNLIACNKTQCDPKAGPSVANVCPCKDGLFKESDGKCTFPANGCNKMDISIWTAVSAADGKLPFSSKLLNRKRAASIQIPYSQLNSTANVLDLDLGQVKLTSKKNVAVLVKGCFCTRITPVYRAIAVTSAGKARLAISGGLFGQGAAVYNLDASKGTKTEYYSMLQTKTTNELCTRFELAFYSGTLSGILGIRSVIFPYSKDWTDTYFNAGSQPLP